MLAFLMEGHPAVARAEPLTTAATAAARIKWLAAPITALFQFASWTERLLLDAGRSPRFRI
jgi:hypothetical protein